MRITRLETLHLRPRWLVVRVHTDTATLGETLLTEPFAIHDGCAELPNGPGLGIELDESKVRAQRFDGRWDAPSWSHVDGGIAEW
ncbi:MAG: enolase C-terminal domain-like protein [Opitutaceae bacterium]